MFKKIIVLTCVLFISACASNVKISEGSEGYNYSGEKYGEVSVELSGAVSEDSRKIVRTEQLDLESKIKASLISKGVYEDGASNKIKVVINQIHIRNAFNAIMFGFMSGSDSLDGTVTLENDTSTSFDISASYAMGGIAGGQNSSRLGWLSEKFAELTTKTILGEQIE